MNSVMMGFIVGSAAGPIGSLLGAAVGYIHGQSAKKEMEQRAQLEADRQKKLDQELEQQILAQRGEGNLETVGAAEPAVPEQGVIIVEDHLAEPGTGGGSSATEASQPGVVVVTDHLAPPAPERVLRGSPPPAEGSGSSAPVQAPTLARVPPEKVDQEGFKTIYEDNRLVRRERDLNGDGKPDIVMHYDAQGQLVRREESSQLDGRIDTWTFYAGGKIERKESDTDGDGEVDLWAYYGREGDLVRLKSVVDPRRSLTQFYAEGQVVREEWRREPGGQLQTRLSYRDGKVVKKEEDSTGSGRLDLVSTFDADGRLVKQGRTASDGGVLAWRYFDPERGTVLREEEIGGSGDVVAVSYYKNGKLARRELYELEDGLFTRVPLMSAPGGQGGG
ncbi:MAG: FG-GAP repeat domain-containing protein [Candidatus Methylomirabilia bacterium]